MEQYIEKDGKRLRLGYTTGSCAAAAAKAAAWMLLTGRRKETITLDTPKGIRLELAVREITMRADSVSCAIEKDSGDDPDVTKGTLIFASVRRTDEPGVHIDGGEGVGRVTKRGLDQPVGNAAINSVPRQMIRENVEEVMALTDFSGGLDVVISAPEGETLAKKTFNPRLGIVGGISILGTTGIVEPMSEAALVETIRVELRQRRAMGKEYALLTPGNYGSDFIRQNLDVDLNTAVQVSNFLGDALDICRALGFRGANVQQLVQLYTTADLLVNPSVEETFGMTILEAHCCGTPSLVYQGTACEEVASLYGGRAVPRGAEELHRAIESMYHKEESL